jgi:hypothetical protein
VGDVAGVRLGAGQPIVAPTPPPDFNLELWTESVGRILDWRPDSLFLTHFGPSTPPAPHLQTLLERLRHFADLAKAILEAGGTEREQAGQFRDQVQAELRRETKDRDVRYYDLAVPLEHCYLGLARYLRRS